MTPPAMSDSKCVKRDSIRGATNVVKGRTTITFVTVLKKKRCGQEISKSVCWVIELCNVGLSVLT